MVASFRNISPNIFRLNEFLICCKNIWFSFFSGSIIFSSRVCEQKMHQFDFSRRLEANDCREEKIDIKHLQIPLHLQIQFRNKVFFEVNSKSSNFAAVMNWSIKMFQSRLQKMLLQLYSKVKVQVLLSFSLIVHFERTQRLS